jgi:hypothetical protein
VYPEFPQELCTSVQGFPQKICHNQQRTGCHLEQFVNIMEVAVYYNRPVPVTFLSNTFSSTKSFKARLHGSISLINAIESTKLNRVNSTFQ